MLYRKYQESTQPKFSNVYNPHTGLLTLQTFGLKQLHRYLGHTNFRPMFSFSKIYIINTKAAYIMYRFFLWFPVLSTQVLHAHTEPGRICVSYKWN